MKLKTTPKLIRGLALSILFLQNNVIFAQTKNVETTLNNFKSWLSPVLDAVIYLCLIVSFVAVVISVSSSSQDSKRKATFFLIACILWGIKKAIFSDLAGIFI